MDEMTPEQREYWDETKVTVRELIEQLSKQDPDARIFLRIGSPVDSAYTSAELKVQKTEEGVSIEGYVSSDDPNAGFPGLYGDED